MLANYFTETFTIQRLHSGPSGPYMDGFAQELRNKQYGWETARRYLRGASHLGQYLKIVEVELNWLFRFLGGWA